MKTYVIERDLPGVGGMDAQAAKGAAAKSNEALDALAPRVTWKHSYVTADKTFCIYEAEDEAAIHEHARLSGFPASVVTEVTGMLTPQDGR